MSSENDLAPIAQAVLTHIVKAVVLNSDEVYLDVYESQEFSELIHLDVSVGEGDMGRVIGKRGRMADDIRNIVESAALADDCEVQVEFLDD